MSGRIRTIKPELLEDAVTAGLSDTAFRIFTACILLADDYGNFRADPEWLRCQIHWRVPPAKPFEEALKELPRLIEFYGDADQRYGHIRKWEKHQKISHRGKPRIPGPPQSSGDPPEGGRKVSGDPPESLRPDHRSPTTITDHHAGAEELPELSEAKSETRLREVPDPAEGITPVGATSAFAMAEEYAAAAAEKLGGFSLDDRGAGVAMKRAINGFVPAGIAADELRARIRFSVGLYLDERLENSQYEAGFQPRSWGKWLNAERGWTLAKPAPRSRPSGVHAVVSRVPDPEVPDGERRAAASAAMALLGAASRSA